MKVERIPALKPVDQIVITLTADEAEVLNGLFRSHIIGPDEGARGITSRLGEALSQAGVGQHLPWDRSKSSGGHIWLL